MPHVKYDQHYLDDPTACGDPFAEFVRFCAEVEAGTVLDLGCGQGRDALVFARAGHRVLGVDLSQVGVSQMLATARSEGLAVEGEVADVATWQPPGTFDLVILDRVLHMIAADSRMAVLDRGMAALAPGGHLLVAEGPKGMIPVRRAVEAWGLEVVVGTKNRLIARRAREDG